MSTAAIDRTMPCISAWRNNPKLARWLAEILDSREGQLFMGALSEMATEMRVDSIALIGAVTDPMQRMALGHAAHAGRDQVIRSIREMSIAADEVTPLPDPFDYPEDSTEEPA